MERRKFLQLLIPSVMFLKEIASGQQAQASDERLTILREINERFELEYLSTGIYDYLKANLDMVWLLKTIIDNRDSISLYSWPFVLWGYTPDKTNSKWVNQQNTSVKNKLPQNQKAYGVFAEQVFQALLEEKAGVIVEKISGSGSLGSIGFGGAGEKQITIPAEYNWDMKNFLQILLHEGMGHGTDANGMDYLPPEVFFPLLMGYSRIISQCWSLPGELLNHPGDMILPIVTYEMGTSMIQDIIHGYLKDFAPLEYPAIQRLFNQVATEQNLEKYGRKFCYRLGQLLVEAIRNKEMLGYPALMFEWSLGEYAREIYAEGMRLVLQPRRVFGADDPIVDKGLQEAQENIVMVAGCLNILETITGKKVDLDKIRAKLALVYQASHQLEIVPVEEATQQIDPEQEKINSLREALFAGQVPFIPELVGHGNIVTLLQRFSILAHAFLVNYDQVRVRSHHPGVDMNNLDIRGLHGWETDTVQEVLSNPGVDWVLSRILEKDFIGLEEDFKKNVTFLEKMGRKAGIVADTDLLH
jgi:hypothetical protein